MGAGTAHPGAMAPRTPGATRTAPPMRKPGNSRTRTYTLFGLTGFVYLLVSFVALRIVWNLGNGLDAWNDLIAELAHPGYIAFHLVSFVSVVFVAVRFFGLFPKAQPARIGPAKPPPAPLLHAMLYVLWLGITAVFSAILAGVIF